MQNKVEAFIRKSKLWQDEMATLRTIILECGLQENIKWGQPCYSYNNSNIVIIQAFKNFLGLMFFKGSLLKDPKKVLIKNGPNSRAACRLEFYSYTDISKQAKLISMYIREAIEVEKSGKKIDSKKIPLEIPVELKTVFLKNSKLKKAFESLTPGRQRAYVLHFSGAKQSVTRLSRIKKCIPDILNGKGIND